MTLMHRSQLLAALLGSAFLSCAGGGAREDNQAPAAPAPRFARLDHAPSGPGVYVAAPQWHQPLRVQNAPLPRQHVRPGWRAADRQDGPPLGVTVDSSNDGLRVKEVLDVSLAHSAGVKVDDVLLRVGDERVDRVADVRQALAGKRPGDQVKVAVIRAGEGIVELTGTVPEPPADSATHDGGRDAAGPRLAARGGDGARGGFLGVELKETEDGAAGAPADDAAATTGTSEPGVLIEAVVPNSAAWFAGLDPQDRLLSIDGQALASRADLVGAVASKEPGSVVELKYLRDGQEHTVSVRLGQRGPLSMLGSLQDIPGLLDLQDLQGLRGLKGLGQAAPRPFDRVHVRSFDPFGPMDLTSLMGDLQIDVGGAQSLQVEIDGDRMTVERDGRTEHYRRDADGQWQPSDGSTDGSLDGTQLGVSDPSRA